MTTRGRKPKPTKIHELNGNPSRLNLGKRKEKEIKPSTGAPTCPSWLDTEAKREWKRIVPELAKLGVITMIDRAALAGYCVAYSRWRTAEEELGKGFTYEYYDSKTFQLKRTVKPEVQIARNSLNQVKAFCSEFGLTPSSRSRLVLPGEPKDEDPVDKMLKEAGL
ncbi:phage terminase small subunit P27 family [Dehalococcoides mccartyi]|jgi:P27 family predicted phage terminase small subunit|uniref:phage terminase small subunit P27 family n=1 Tax=Dehalococcoides mccartyi TaxID=61435 RepID=UPI000990149E|nr:phage terminase small subunit P27 family [Dehalococcoides mccartyi]AQU06097.1 hypothetical protein B1777_05280 [Dehalococcoides mccartyi]AQU07540.1 hypothetical protein B1778_05080 [Dehalococcoides mccartyi]AQX74786.1 hypothetical protein B1776_04375 [Dehalococcoides mccartyi]AQY73363.1 hypothetical protein B1772_04685 [Dehalococcoides mccartyi]QBX64063.1 phage terminase small subunit P27 family [Dehalococcoides mccartyi]